MDPLLLAGIIELGKMGLMQYFEAQRLAGKTKEEVKAYMLAAHEEFMALPDPSTIPDPE